MITILVILLSISIGIGIFLYISLLKAFNTIDSLEENLTKTDNLNNELQTWVLDFRKLMNNVYKKLKSVDERGIFEKDDDVGFIFQDMLNIIVECNKRINDNDDNNPSDEKQSQK